LQAFTFFIRILKAEFEGLVVVLGQVEEYGSGFEDGEGFPAMIGYSGDAAVRIGL
jgi:hypothetical protein